MVSFEFLMHDTGDKLLVHSDDLGIETYLNIFDLKSETHLLMSPYFDLSLNNIEEKYEGVTHKISFKVNHNDLIFDISSKYRCRCYQKHKSACMWATPDDTGKWSIHSKIMSIAVYKELYVGDETKYLEYSVDHEFNKLTPKRVSQTADEINPVRNYSRRIPTILEFEISSEIDKKIIYQNAYGKLTYNQDLPHLVAKKLAEEEAEEFEAAISKTLLATT